MNELVIMSIKFNLVERKKKPTIFRATACVHTILSQVQPKKK